MNLEADIADDMTPEQADDIIEYFCCILFQGPVWQMNGWRIGCFPKHFHDMLALRNILFIVRI